MTDFAIVPDDTGFAYMAEEDAWHYSRNAEQNLLGSLLLDPGIFDDITAEVSLDDFFVPAHRLVFGAIGRLCSTGGLVDWVTVADELRVAQTLEAVGGEAYVRALEQAVSSAYNATSYAKIVRERAIARQLADACDRATSLARGPGDPVGKVDAIASMFSSLERGQLRDAPRQIAQLALDRMSHYTELDAGNIEPGWPTRIPSLDRALMGGVRPGGLYIVAARPGVGKSSLAEHIATTQAKAGLPALFLSLEMSHGEVVDRAVSNLGHVSYRSIMTGRLDKDGRRGEWESVTSAFETLRTLPLWIDDQPALTLQTIRSKAKSCKGLRLLVVDYLQLCGSGRRDGNRNAEIEEITRGLKTLAKELGIAVLALSQLNRDVEKRANRRPQLSDLRDSGAVEQDADVVLFLWPVREFTGEGRKIIGLGIDKNRQGPSGVEFGLDFFGDFQRWGESTADIRPPARLQGPAL